ncbi:MAG: hypothetical protein D6706_06450, partial [Chloroflexi bacterium]
MKKHAFPTNSIRFYILVAFFYALCISLMTWPATIRLNQQLIGNNIDNWIFYWNNWWFKQATLTGQSWFFTDYLFYPNGTSLVTHSHSLLNSALAMVVEPVTGPVAAYNLVFLLGLWIGALGVYIFIYHLTQQPGAAFLAGLVFTFAPYHLTQSLAHLHLGSIHWWPWYAFMLHRVFVRRYWVDALGAGVFAALTLWSGWQLAVLLALWTAVFFPYALWTHRQMLPERPFRHHLIRATLILILATLLLSLPILLPLAQNWQTVTANELNFDEGTTRQTDLLAYWVPPTYHSFWGEKMVPIYERFEANRANMAYLGYTAVLLALFAILRGGKNGRFWGSLFLLWLILAAGNTPRLNGQTWNHIPLPFTWLGQIFPISAIRAPDRFNLLVVFSLAVLAGLGAAYLLKQTDRRWLFWPLMGLILIEYIPLPLPMWELPPTSPFLAELANNEEKTAVIDYPLGYTNAKLWLYYQTIHQQPIVEGHVSRYTADTYTFITNTPLLRHLYQYT